MKKHLSGFIKRPDFTKCDCRSGCRQDCGFSHFIFILTIGTDVCYLQDLYVSDTLRGQGIGRLLIEAVYDEADKRGIPTVYCTPKTSISRQGCSTTK